MVDLPSWPATPWTESIIPERARLNAERVRLDTERLALRESREVVIDIEEARERRDAWAELRERQTKHDEAERAWVSNAAAQQVRDTEAVVAAEPLEVTNVRLHRLSKEVGDYRVSSLMCLRMVGASDETLKSLGATDEQLKEWAHIINPGWCAR